MNTGVVSRRYVKALLAYAKTVNKEDKVYQEMKRLATYFDRVADLRHAVENPVLDVQTKLKLLHEAAGGANVSDELMRFFSLVLEEKREKFLQFMTWSYIDLYREDKNILIGKLMTAMPSPKLEDYLKKSLSKSNNNATIELDTKVDSELIGGYIVEVAGYRMDASVANQLKRVKQQFIAKNRRII